VARTDTAATEKLDGCGDPWSAAILRFFAPVECAMSNNLLAGSAEFIGYQVVLTKTPGNPERTERRRQLDACQAECACDCACT
jgi:hypothetical protein